MKNAKYLIVGGGISGLRFANYVGDNYLILEKEDNIGGLCRTHYVKEYVWDYAGHFFHFSTPQIKSFFEEHLDATEMVKCKKNTKIYYKGKLIDYPFQKNIHQLDKNEFIECLYYLFFKKEKKKYSDFLDMLYGKFGQGITEKFLKPYNEKLYACSLMELDTDAMGRFFPYAEIDEIVKNMFYSDNSSYNEFFDYPKRGAQAIIDILNQDIMQDKVLLNTELKSLDINKRIAYIDNDAIQYKYLINTIPFNKFVKLYNSNLNTSVLSANKVMVFNLGFDKKTEIDDIHWIYFPSKEQVFYRVGFYDNILSTKKGSMYIEIGYSEKEEITQEIIDKTLIRVLDDLKKCGIILNQKLVAHECLMIDPGYVHITVEGNKAVEEEMKYLAEYNVFSIGRYGKWTYCSMEDCMLQAKEIQERIVKNDCI